MSASLQRLRATVRLDMALQQRNQLYAIGVGVAVLMGLAVRFMIPEAYIGRGLAAFYVVGLGGTTFIFGSAMLLLEKGEGTLAALRVSQITTADYVLSKVLTLTGFALVESGIVYAISARGVPTQAGWLLLGSVVLGTFYTLLGLALAARYEAITTFLLPTGAVVAMVLQFPFLIVLGVEPAAVWYAIPTAAPLLLILAAFEPLSPSQWAYTACMTPTMLLAAAWFCRRRFAQYIQFPEA